MKKTAILLIILLILPFSCILASENVQLGGDSIGVEAKYQGVYISGTYPFTCGDENIQPDKNIQIKDVIVSVNNQRIKDLTHFTTLLSPFKGTKNVIPVGVVRNGKELQTTLTTNYENGKYTYGLYLKDTILGIGTLTFYHPKEGTFAALGHPISNEDNNLLQNGYIYDANITRIEKGKHEQAGEKNGQIQYNQQLGIINKNNVFGIYGKTVNGAIPNEMIETANKDEIKLKEAQFYTVLEGGNIELFTIEITRINQNELDKEKAITFKVTDPLLLEKSGGIIHGMSGSPIVQDGKLIGAITHVSVDDQTIGYAIFIDVMLNECKE